MKAKKLNKGDTIAIIAPSYMMKPEYVEKSVLKLKEMGYKVRFSANLFSDTNGYAGSIQERADDFNKMIADNEIKMLLFGGGEVSNEIIPYIDYGKISDNPKIICSYSDSTSLLDTIYSRTGLVTFYGASLRTVSEANAYNLRSFNARLASQELFYEKSQEWHIITQGKCEGILIGGYLVNYAALFGNPYFIPITEKHILFIEDHKMFSSPAIVSKWFSNLEMYGAFRNVAGLIFGHYSDEYESAIDPILARIGNKYSIPVVRCDDFGHGTYNSIFPIGIHASLSTADGMFRLQESGVL